MPGGFNRASKKRVVKQNPVYTLLTGFYLCLTEELASESI
jgi:hypothetical protein